MPVREKKLLSIAATHPQVKDISHLDVLIDFYDGEYRIVLQPYNRTDSLHSKITVIGNRYGMNIGATLPLFRAGRFSAKRLADTYPTLEHWRQINDIITRQCFILTDTARDELNAEIDIAEEADAQR